MSTTDTRADQIEVLAEGLCLVDETDPIKVRAAALLDGPIAAMIAQAERAAAAKALREAVEGWSTTEGDGTFLSNVKRDLLARADRIEAGQ